MISYDRLVLFLCSLPITFSKFFFVKTLSVIFVEILQEWDDHIKTQLQHLKLLFVTTR